MKSPFEFIMSVKSESDLFESKTAPDKTQRGKGRTLVPSVCIGLASNSEVPPGTNKSRSPQNEVRPRTLGEAIQVALDCHAVNEKSLILPGRKIIEGYENKQKRLNKLRSTDSRRISSTILEMTKAKHAMQKALNNLPAAFDKDPNLTSEVSNKSIFRSHLLSSYQFYDSIIVHRSPAIFPLSAPEKFYSIELPDLPLTTITDEVDREMSPETTLTSSPELVPVTNHEKVFIVHGHDHTSRDTVADFVDNWGLTPTVLDKQPSESRTIIEKFEQCAGETDFAIVLMTPDDVGASKKNRADLKYRARQNVIFELGYFFGSIGRKRVCILYKGNLELPSDIQGVVYVPMDESGEWKQKIVREMEAVGLLIDGNEI